MTTNGNPKIIKTHAVFDDTNEDYDAIGAAVWWTNQTGAKDLSYVEIHMVSGTNDKVFVQEDKVPDSPEIYFDPCEILVPENAKTDEVIFRTYTGGPGNLILIQEIIVPILPGNVKELERS